MKDAYRASGAPPWQVELTPRRAHQSTATRSRYDPFQVCQAAEATRQASRSRRRWRATGISGQPVRLTLTLPSPLWPAPPGTPHVCVQIRILIGQYH